MFNTVYRGHWILKLRSPMFIQYSRSTVLNLWSTRI